MSAVSGMMPVRLVESLFSRSNARPIREHQDFARKGPRSHVRLSPAGSKQQIAGAGTLRGTAEQPNALFSAIAGPPSAECWSSGIPQQAAS